MDNFIFFTWPTTLNSESRRRPAEPEHGLLNIDGVQQCTWLRYIPKHLGRVYFTLVIAQNCTHTLDKKYGCVK